MSDAFGIEDVYALSPMQQGMLYHTRYTSYRGVYINQAVCTLLGELDVTAFQQAWQQLITHHPLLRTAFLWEDGDEPVQVVSRSAQVSWGHYDWRGSAAESQRS